MKNADCGRVKPSETGRNSERGKKKSQSGCCFEKGREGTQRGVTLDGSCVLVVVASSSRLHVSQCRILTPVSILMYPRF